MYLSFQEKRKFSELNPGDDGMIKIKGWVVTILWLLAVYNTLLYAVHCNAFSTAAVAWCISISSGAAQTGLPNVFGT